MDKTNLVLSIGGAEKLMCKRYKNKKYHVCGLGNALVDVQLQIAEKEFEELGFEKGSMTLVTQECQEETLKRFAKHKPHYASGGSAANTMIAISQLGGETAYGCLVGADEHGEFYQEEMGLLGIHVETIPLEAHPTGTCLIFITPDAERTMNTFLGASALFSEEHVSQTQIQQSEWLYIEGYLFSSEAGQRAVKTALEHARQGETRVAITFSDGFIVDVFGEVLREAVEASSLVFANFHESQRFTGKDNEESIFRALRDSCPNVCMTMGERGARIVYNGEEEFISPFPVSAIDDTGAGDMFAGGFLFGITHGFDALSSGKLACFLASRVVSQLGPRLLFDLKALPEVKSFLNKVS